MERAVATVLLNRPEKRNALNGAMVRGLAGAMERAEADQSVRVVAVRGAGDDFCSGADLAELEEVSALGREENLADARRLGEVFLGIRRLAKPVVAVVHGRALAGGCGLATACDLVVAHEDAALGYPEVHLGFVPAMVMAILRRKVSEARAFELVIGGRRIAAAEAARIGLVNKVVPSGSFAGDVEAYLQDLASRPPSAIALTKRLLYDLYSMGLEEGIALGAEVNVEARLTDACREGLRRFLDRSRRP